MEKKENIFKTEKFEFKDYLVCLKKVYNPGLFGALFPPQVPGTHNDLKLFGVFRIDAHNGYTDWGVNFKVRLTPIGDFARIMTFDEYYTMDIMDIIVDSDKFIDYINFYHFTDALKAEKFAQEMNAKILDSLYFKHYLSNEGALAEQIGRENFNSLSFLLEGCDFDTAFVKLAGYNRSNLDYEDNEVAEHFDCNFNDVTARIFRTEDGNCSISRLIEVWNKMRTQSISVMVY